MISILQMQKWREMTSPGSHSKSLMRLVLAASIHSYLVSNAGDRGEQRTQARCREKNLGAPHRLRLTGLGVCCLCCLHGLVGLGGRGERGQLEEETF